MNVLVTGCAGHIGSRLSREMVDQGHRIIGYDGLIYGGESVLPLLDRRGFDLLVGNIMTINATSEEMYPEDVHAIIHLAAIVGEPACNASPQTSTMINVDGTREVLRFWQERYPKAKFVFASTCSLYGNQPPNKEATEETDIEPLSTYAQNKADSECDVINAGGTVLRFGTAVGWSFRPRFDTLANELLLDAYLRQRVVVYRPEALRAWASIEDICSAIIAVIRGSPRARDGEIYNVVSENTTKREMAARVRRHFPEAAYAEELNRGDPRSYSVSDEKIHSVFGWESKKGSVDDTISQLAHLLKAGFYLNLNSERFRNA